MPQWEDIDFGTIITSVLKQPDVTDVMIWEGEVWITDIRRGHYHLNLEPFGPQAMEQLQQVSLRLPRQIALRMKTSFNDSSPILDGEGQFGGLGQLRFNVIHENLTASNYPALAIRKSAHQLRISQASMLATHYADESFFDLMQTLVASGCNIIIAGATGSGKTELLRYLARWIDASQAVITIEDTLEAYLKDLYPDRNILALKANALTDIGALLRPCLRQNPDWICVSETRGKEVLHLLEAVSTGHCLISTIHTNGAANIPMRMLEMSGIDSDNRLMLLQQIYSNIDIGIYISYRNDQSGSHRRIAEVAEYYLDSSMKMTCHLLYVYDFKTGGIKRQPISSPKIYRKFYEQKTDLTRLQKGFL